MRAQRWCLVAVGAAVLALAPGSTLAQQARGGLIVQSYTMTDKAAVGLGGVSLLSAPLTARADLPVWGELSLWGGWARASATSAAGVQSVVQGLLDTSLRLRGSLAGFVLTLEAVLPTGSPVATTEEAAVVGLLSSGLMPFIVTRWGSGFGFGAQAAYTLRLGRTRVGLTAGRSSMAEYAPLPDSWSGYEPGDRTHLRVVTESELGLAGVLTAVAGVQLFGTDAVGPDVAVEPGDRLTGQISYAFPLGAREGATLYAGIAHRGEGAVVAPDAPEATTLDALLKGPSTLASRQRITVGAEAAFTRDRTAIRPRAEFSVLRAADGLGQGWMTSLEARGERRISGGWLGPGFLLEPFVGMSLGTIESYGGLSSMFYGWAAGLTVRGTLGP